MHPYSTCTLLIPLHPQSPNPKVLCVQAAKCSWGKKQFVSFVDSRSNVAKIAYTKYSVMSLYEQIIASRNCTRLNTQGNSCLADSKKVPCSDNHIREKKRCSKKLQDFTTELQHKCMNMMRKNAN